MEVAAIVVAAVAVVISVASYARGRYEARLARRQLSEDRHELAVEGERMRHETALYAAQVEQLQRELAAMRGAVFGRLAALQDFSREAPDEERSAGDPEPY